MAIRKPMISGIIKPQSKVLSVNFPESAIVCFTDFLYLWGMLINLMLRASLKFGIFEYCGLNTEKQNSSIIDKERKKERRG